MSAGGALASGSRDSGFLSIGDRRFSSGTNMSEEDIEEALLYRQAFDMMKEKKLIHGNILMFHQKHKIEGAVGQVDRC